VTRSGIESFREHIRERIKVEGLRPFAARIGVPVGHVRSLSTDRPAKSTTIESVVDALGLVIAIEKPRPAEPFANAPPWAQSLRDDLALLLGQFKSNKVLQFVPAGEDVGAEDEFESVRRYDRSTLRLAAGSHSFPDIELVASEVRFRRDWLRAHHLQAANLVLLDATGDSMAPAIRDGDSVLVDESRVKPVDGRVFAMRTIDGPLVKRLRKRRGRWWAVSDNQEHKSRPVFEEDRLLGLVVWWAHSE